MGEGTKRSVDFVIRKYEEAVAMKRKKKTAAPAKNQTPKLFKKEGKK